MAVAHDPAVAATLSRHVHVVQTQIVDDIAVRAGLVRTPFLVLLAVYTEEIHKEAVAAGWQPPLVWSSLDGLSLRLLACCTVASNPRAAPARR
ncbi:MAG: DUF6401 family natural product biosynthesis protein [Kibdelosporangium sp.]